MLKSATTINKFYYIGQDAKDTNKIDLFSVPKVNQSPINSTMRVIENQNMIYSIYYNATTKMTLESYVKGSELGANEIWHSTNGKVVGVSMPYRNHISKHRLIIA